MKVGLKTFPTFRAQSQTSIAANSACFERMSCPAISMAALSPSASTLAGHGWAVPYRDCKRKAVRDASEFARNQRAGIWGGEFVMPWEWRAAH